MTAEHDAESGRTTVSLWGSNVTTAFGGLLMMSGSHFRIRMQYIVKLLQERDPSAEVVDMA